MFKYNRSRTRKIKRKINDEESITFFLSRWHPCTFASFSGFRLAPSLLSMSRPSGAAKFQFVLRMLATQFWSTLTPPKAECIFRTSRESSRVCQMSRKWETCLVKSSLACPRCKSWLKISEYQEKFILEAARIIPETKQTSTPFLLLANRWHASASQSGSRSHYELISFQLISFLFDLLKTPLCDWLS